MITIVVANQKGGSGKTTTTSIVGAELAIRGYKVLIVDCDPQSNTTRIFTDPSQVNASIADVLIPTQDSKSKTKSKLSAQTTKSISNVLINTEIKTLHLVPASIDLAVFDRGKELTVVRLQRALREVKDNYDFCVIDTPPNLGMLLSAALVAADYILVPVQAEPLAVEGLRDLLEVIEEAREMNEGIKILGAVTTMLDARTNVGREIYDGLQKEFPYKAFKTAINRQIKLCECPAVHKPIQLYAPKSTGARDYSELTKEILSELGLPAKAKS